MSFNKWVIANADRELAKSIAEECDIDPIAALILSSRGYKEPIEIEQLLSNDPIISSPHNLFDIDIAVENIKQAIEEDLLIAIYGDYDCDGICATALLYRYLSDKGVRAVYYIPDRFTEGYGMNTDAIDSLYAKGVGMIITVDNGIASFEEIEYANSLGIKTVVTDHHLPKENLPEAVAVIDPHRDTCAESFKDVCGTVVAYKLLCALENKECEELINKYSDILAIATIGDIMPLKYENRDIVKRGILKIKQRPLTGIEALISVAGMSRNDINSSRIAFGLVPRINAAGRMGNAARAVELLLCDNILNALEIANDIDADNTRRHQVETQIFDEACGLIEENGYKFNRVIVVSGKNWHSGVLGIVASKIADKYSRPTIVLTEEDDGLAFGSGRSIADFSLFNAINYCEELLVKFGGHTAAAGLTLESSNISIFREKINEFAQTFSCTNKILNIDFKLNPKALTTDICYCFEPLEPFGQANPVPVFGIFGCKIEKITPIGNGKHLRILFSKENTTFQGLYFGKTTDTFAYKLNDMVDLAVCLEINYFKDVESLSIKIKDMRISALDEEKLFNEVGLTSDYLSGISGDYSNITPTREEIGEVFRAFANGNNEEYVLNQFVNTLGYGKTFIAVTVLKDLNLIEYKENKLYIVKNAPKTNLTNSDIYKNLLS